MSHQRIDNEVLNQQFHTYPSFLFGQTRSSDSPSLPWILSPSQRSASKKFIIKPWLFEFWKREIRQGPECHFSSIKYQVTALNQNLIKGIVYKFSQGTSPLDAHLTLPILECNMCATHMQMSCMSSETTCMSSETTDKLYFFRKWAVFQQCYSVQTTLVDFSVNFAWPNTFPSDNSTLLPSTLLPTTLGDFFNPPILTTEAPAHFNTHAWWFR